MAAAPPANRSTLRNIGWLMLVLVIALSLPAARLIVHVRHCRIADGLGKLYTQSVGPWWLARFVEKHRLFILGQPIRLVAELDAGPVDNDTAIESIATLESIADLSLSGKELNDDQLLRLRALRNLTSLELLSNRLTSRGLTVIESLPELRTLSIPAAEWVDDRALVSISRATELESLTLLGAAITDDGLAQLTSLRKLRVLDLSHTEIHDNGLDALASLPALERLAISGTRVTDEGVAALRHALPHLEITDD